MGFNSGFKGLKVAYTFIQQNVHADTEELQLDWPSVLTVKTYVFNSFNRDCGTYPAGVGS